MQTTPHKFSITARDRMIARFAALAIAIHLLEAAVPMPLPGVKPGLANVIVLLVLLRHDLSAAVQVGLLRVIVGSLLLGTFMTPTFMLSFSGAAASLAVLALASRLPRRWLGPIGLAVLAAVTHMGTQFFVAWKLFLPHAALLNLLPVLLLASLLFGIATGILTARLLDRLPPAARLADTGLRDTP